MTPLSLLDWHPPAQQHSKPSLAAADAIRPTAATLRGQVLDFLRGQKDGATDEEVISGTGIAASTARPRRVELVRLGLVADSGTTRRTKSGRAATVWRAVSHG